METAHTPVPINPDNIRIRAHAVAEALRRAGPIPAQIRAQFIEIRSALFERGVFDPVLARFDSATVPQASAAEVAAQLEMVTGALA